MQILEFASLRNARILNWVCLVAATASSAALALFLMAVAEYPDVLTPLRYTIGGVAAGMALGGSVQLFAHGRYMRALALVKGEGMRNGSDFGSTPVSVRPPE